MISTKLEESVDLNNGYYNGDYILLKFNQEGGVDIEVDHIDIEANPEMQDLQDIILDNERECHWGVVFEDNSSGKDNKESFLRANRQYLYRRYKLSFVKCGYYVVVSGSYGKNLIWGVVYNCVVEKPNYNDQIGQQDF